MLAYIFWHWPLESVKAAEYERSLDEFHRTLGESGCEGFIASTSFRVRGAPWLNDGAGAYADWYLLEGSFALDPLNEVAVSGSRKEPHDEAARSAAKGAGGLYRLVAGEAALDATGCETWITKPKSLPYAELYKRLRPFTDSGVELWRRQLVLGPASEFCLVSHGPLSLPPDLSPVAVPRERVKAG